MSLFRKSQVLEAKRMSRWVTILDGDETINAPDLKFLIGFISDKRFSSLVKPYERKGVVTMNQADSVSFRKNVVLDCVSDWQGMCPQNAKRLCEILLTNPEMIEGAPSDMPFDSDDLGFIGENMSAAIFNSKVLDEAMNLEEYAKEAIRNPA